VADCLEQAIRDEQRHVLDATARRGEAIVYIFGTSRQSGHPSRLFELGQDNRSPGCGKRKILVMKLLASEPWVKRCCLNFSPKGETRVRSRLRKSFFTEPAKGYCEDGIELQCMVPKRISKSQPHTSSISRVSREPLMG